MDHHHFDTLAVALSQPQSRRGTVRLLGLVLAGGTVTIGGIAVVPPAAARKRKPKPRKPTCRDGVRNGTETDVDCGGGTCPRCSDGQSCQEANDCRSGTCRSRQCVTCTLKDLCGADRHGACQCNEDFATREPVCLSSAALGLTVDDCAKCPAETDSCVTINGLLFNCYQRCGA